MFLLVTFGQKNDVTWDSNDSLMNQWMWLIIYAATKVKSVDKNCPPLKFVGQHGVSYLGHKRPKMLKNSEWQACMVDTILGQCVTFNPLRVPLSTLPSPGSCGCHFQPRCHTWVGLSMKYLYCQYRGGEYMFVCMFLFVLQCLAGVSKVVMEYVLSAMSGNLVLREYLQ